MNLRLLSVVGLGILGFAAAAAAARPVAVSPGSTAGIAQVPDPCPTFSWSAVTGASGYELVVLSADESPVETPAETPAELGTFSSAAPPALAVEIRGAAIAWTPSAEQCLAAGRRYAWSVRAITGEGAGPWAEAQLFEVGAGGAADLEFLVEQVLERLLTARGLGAGATGGGATPEAASAVDEVAGAERAASAALPGASAVLPSDETGLYASTLGTSGVVTYGVHGVTNSNDTGSTGVVGEATAGVGVTRGVIGSVASSSGIAGLFENSGGGVILSGRNASSEVFHIDSAGEMTAQVFHGDFQGDGSGLTNVSVDNTDKVDGYHADDLLRSNWSDTFTGNQLTIATGKELNVDGTLRMDGPVVKSGTETVTNFNADRVDSLHASQFLRSDQDTTLTGNLRIDTGPFEGSYYREDGINRRFSGTTNFNIHNDYGDMELLVEGHEVWHFGNDGHASGLDADKLDDVHGSSFLRSDTSDSYVSGTLSMSGSTTLDVDGTLRMDGPVVKSGTGLVTNFNADLLDGLNGGQFLRNDQSGTLSGYLTLDDGSENATFKPWAVELSSGSAETFNFYNSGSGSVELQVDYSTVLTAGSLLVGNGAVVSIYISDCGDFIPVAFCPVGGTDGPDCSTVVPGAYCEYDSPSGCTMLVDNNNCGQYDWYFRVR